MTRYIDKILTDGEHVVFEARVSLWSQWRLIALGMVTLPLVGFGVFLLLRAWLIYRTTELAITTKRIVSKTGILRRKQRRSCRPIWFQCSYLNSIYLGQNLPVNQHRRYGPLGRWCQTANGGNRKIFAEYPPCWPIKRKKTYIFQIHKSAKNNRQIGG